MTSFAIIGFGEVGSRFACDLHEGGADRIVAFDIADEAMNRAVSTDYVSIAKTAAQAAKAAAVVFVAVTAGTVIEAMTDLSHGFGGKPFVVDVNSASPSTKQKACQIVCAAGGRYVEAAVMTSVQPLGLCSPMLLGGAYAAEWSSLLVPFGMQLTLFNDKVGAASSVKCAAA